MFRGVATGRPRRPRLRLVLSSAAPVAVTGLAPVRWPSAFPFPTGLDRWPSRKEIAIVETPRFSSAPEGGREPPRPGTPT